jgi:hypothetical protein
LRLVLAGLVRHLLVEVDRYALLRSALTVSCKAHDISLVCDLADDIVDHVVAQLENVLPVDHAQDPFLDFGDVLLSEP